MSCVWVLIIDHQHRPSYGDCFYVSFTNDDITIHDLKKQLKQGENRNDFNYHNANHIEIWRCKTIKLSRKDSFTRLKERLSNFNFSHEEESDVQQLAAGQSLKEIGLEENELLLVVVPLLRLGM